MLTETLLRILLSVIGRCSLMSTSHWLQGKCELTINLSQAVSGMILNNHRRLPVGWKHFQCQNRRFKIMVFEAAY
jgi:hypothetical protein